MFVLSFLLVNGGRGANGQNGGHGYNGQSVNVSALPTVSNKPSDELGKVACRILATHNDTVTRTISRLAKDYAYTEVADWYQEFDVADYCSSAGGDGGHGGYGGAAGVARFFDLGARIALQMNTTTGANGQHGKGGAHGVNSAKSRIRFTVLNQSKYAWSLIESKTDDSCPDVENGTDGGNTKNQKQPDKQTAFDVSTAIIEYLTYLRHAQVDHLFKTELNAFAWQLQTDAGIATNFTLAGFIEELTSLEDEFFLNQQRIDYAPYYLGLCQRIELYVNATSNGLTSEQRKVKYLI